jgi:hypothetical protein
MCNLWSNGQRRIFSPKTQAVQFQKKHQKVAILTQESTLGLLEQVKVNF